MGFALVVFKEGGGVGVCAGWVEINCEGEGGRVGLVVQEEAEEGVFLLAEFLF